VHLKKYINAVLKQMFIFANLRINCQLFFILNAHFMCFKYVMKLCSCYKVRIYMFYIFTECIQSYKSKKCGQFNVYKLFLHILEYFIA